MQLRVRAIEITNLQTKLDMAMASARAAAQSACAEAAGDLRNAVADRINSVYPEDKEIETLMRGIITGAVGWSSAAHFRAAGTAEGGRLDMGRFMPLHQIVRSCPVVTSADVEKYFGGGVTAVMSPMSAFEAAFTPKSVALIGGTYVSASTCDPTYINQLAMFTYYRSSGQAYIAYPFGGKYVESVENGGVWRVKPRMDNKAKVLYPEPGVVAKEMIKMLPPRQPFANTIFRERAGVIMLVMKRIKDAVSFRDIGRGAAGWSQFWGAEYGASKTAVGGGGGASATFVP